MQPRPKPLPRRAVDQQVTELTHAIQELLSATGKHDVGARAAVGHLLLQVRSRLQHGQWCRWLQSQVPFTERTAERAINLHRFRLDQPALYTKIAPLGVAKAYVLMTLAHTTIQSLISRRHLVPSTGAKKSVAQMTFSELMEVLAAHGKPTPDASSALFRTYRRQVRALIRTLDTLIDSHPALTDDELAELHDELVQATERFARAFAIGDD